MSNCHNIYRRVKIINRRVKVTFVLRQYLYIHYEMLISYSSQFGLMSVITWG